MTNLKHKCRSYLEYCPKVNSDFTNIDTSSWGLTHLATSNCFSVLSTSTQSFVFLLPSLTLLLQLSLWMWLKFLLFDIKSYSRLHQLVTHCATRNCFLQHDACKELSPSIACAYKWNECKQLLLPEIFWGLHVGRHIARSWFRLRLSISWIIARTWNGCN